MRKIKLILGIMVMSTMLFTSCSKEEDAGPGVSSDKATLSFTTLIQDLTKKAITKQSIGDLPACTDDTPAYVMIVLMQGDAEILGTSTEPYRVDLVPNETFTKYDPALELVPGTYTLDHFTVYNEAGDLLWIAPRTGSELSDYVDTPLPIDIDLRAGTKMYVDVPVICYDNRAVNQYGYVFFELQTNRAYEYCFFANYCDDNGRHYTANYSVDIWLGTSSAGTPLYTDLQPTTGMDENGEFYADPLCVALPYNEIADEDYIYYEMTLLDWDENYGTVVPRVVSGTLNRNDIEENFGDNMDVNYNHVQFNCIPGEEEPPFPTCLPNPTGDCELLTFIRDVDIEGLPAGTNPTYPLITDGGEEIGTITFTLEVTEDARDLLVGNVALNEGWTGTSARITLPEYVNADDVCVRNINSSNFDVVYQAGVIEYPVVVRFAAIICP
ncbi:MAG: hypothetical protein WBV47_07695 [Salegentibacter sp.]